MRFPAIGDVLEDARGRRFVVTGSFLDESVDDEHPEKRVLYVDLMPEIERPAVPESIRRSMET